MLADRALGVFAYHATRGGYSAQSTAGSGPAVSLTFTHTRMLPSLPRRAWSGATLATVPISSTHARTLARVLDLPKTGGNLPPVFLRRPPRSIVAVWSGVFHGKVLAAAACRVTQSQHFSFTDCSLSAFRYSSRSERSQTMRSPSLRLAGLVLPTLLAVPFIGNQPLSAAAAWHRLPGSPYSYK